MQSPFIHPKQQMPKKPIMLNAAAHTLQSSYVSQVIMQQYQIFLDLLHCNNECSSCRVIIINYLTSHQLACEQTLL